MATRTVPRSADEVRHLAQAASGRATTPAALATRWLRERLVHERERAAGDGVATLPRARRGPPD